MNKKNLILKIRSEIEKASHILVASHINPEGDAIGSSLALYHHFGKNKGIQVLNRDTLPYYLKFLPGSEKIIHNLHHIRNEFELVITVDCANLDRVGENFAEFVRGKRIINIDHHQSNKMFGNLNLVNPDASSAGEIIFEFLSQSRKKISRETATCIYTAIMMDTGGFRFPNTSENTLKIASKLVALGANPSEIAKNVYENHPRSWLMLTALVLQTFSISENGKRAELTLTLDMMKQTGASKEMSEGLVNYLLMINGVEVAILYREVSPDRYKLSFRSRGNLNMAKLAETIGGGGHPQAAGATMEGKLEDIKNIVRKRVDELISRN